MLRGEAGPLEQWVRRVDGRRLAFCFGVIGLGAGLYGAAMGAWHDPCQAGYTAVKFPLIILLTTGGNALLNAMFAPLLGLNVSLRQSLAAVLLSFTIAAAILGSFSPLAAFLVWNAPALSGADPASRTTYGAIQLTHVAVIAFAGLMGNMRLAQLLRLLAGNRAVARRVLFAWLASGLFLGSQLSWILRPFVGSPDLPVVFLRPHPFYGSFYETVFRALTGLFHTH